MLNIGRKTYRNLPEQVGFLTKEVTKIWETLDGLDVYDNVIILDNLDPLSANELEIVNKPVAFIVYSNTLYMKRGVGVNEVYFDAVFQVTGGTTINFNSSEITVSYPLGTLAITNTSAVAYSKGETDTLLSGKLNISDILDTLFPVGYIYMSTVSTSPASLFGGTWEAVEGKFLLSAGMGYSAGDTGGESAHTLDVSEMPSHYHDIPTNSSGPDGEIVHNDWAYCVTSQSAYPIYGYGTYLDGPRKTGGSQPHNNMPPYLVVYVWKRTA